MTEELPEQEWGELGSFDDALRQDLKDLWGGSGLNERSISRCPTLLSQLQSPDAMSAVAALKRLIDQIVEHKYSQAIRQAYGIDVVSNSDSKNVTRRRDALAKRLRINQRTLRFRERKAIDEIVELLESATHGDTFSYEVRFLVGVADRRLFSTKCEGYTVRSNAKLWKEMGKFEFLERKSDEYRFKSADEHAPAVMLELPSHWSRPDRIQVVGDFLFGTPVAVGISSASSLREALSPSAEREVKKEPSIDEEMKRWEFYPSSAHKYHMLWWRWS